MEFVCVLDVIKGSMARITLEEATWEVYKKRPDEVLDTLDFKYRDVVQRMWGIFPYQQHSIRQTSKSLNLPRSTVYFRYRQALKQIKKTFQISILKTR